MERKLISQGGGGFTIYLPKKWIEENNLDKGDELTITISGKELIIGPKKSEKKSETTINLNGLIEPAIRSLITNTYRIGFDKLNISFENEAQFKIIQEILKFRLIGFEVTKKDKNHCIVENVTEPSYDQFDNLLKKMFMNIDELFLITKIKLGMSNEKESEDFYEIEARIMKYDNFCRRVISKQKLIKENSEMFWSFLTLLIHGQRELYHLNKFIKKKISVSKEIEEIFNGCYKIFKLIEKAYYEKNVDILGEVHELENEYIFKKSYNLFKKTNGEDNIIIYHLSMSLREFYQSNSALTGLIV